MDTKQMVEVTLNELDQDLRRALDGLTSEELSWAPEKWANSIGFTLWHVIRAEDLWIHRNGKGVPQIHEAQGWGAKWGIPPLDSGYGYDEDRLAGFPTPPLDELVQYYDAVRQASLKFLGGFTPENFSEPLAVPGGQSYSNGRMFGHLLCEIGEHVGHIRYLRGLKRGLNK